MTLFTLTPSNLVIRDNTMPLTSCSRRSFFSMQLNMLVTSDLELTLEQIEAFFSEPCGLTLFDANMKYMFKLNDIKLKEAQSQPQNKMKETVWELEARVDIRNQPLQTINQAFENIKNTMLQPNNRLALGRLPALETLNLDVLEYILALTQSNTMTKLSLTSKTMRKLILDRLPILIQKSIVNLPDATPGLFLNVPRQDTETDNTQTTKQDDGPSINLMPRCLPYEDAMNLNSILQEKQRMLNQDEFQEQQPASELSLADNAMRLYYLVQAWLTRYINKPDQQGQNPLYSFVSITGLEDARENQAMSNLLDGVAQYWNLNKTETSPSMSMIYCPDRLLESYRLLGNRRSCPNVSSSLDLPIYPAQTSTGYVTFTIQKREASAIVVEVTPSRTEAKRYPFDRWFD